MQQQIELDSKLRTERLNLSDIIGTSRFVHLDVSPAHKIKNDPSKTIAKSALDSYSTWKPFYQRDISKWNENGSSKTVIIDTTKTLNDLQKWKRKLDYQLQISDILEKLATELVNQFRFPNQIPVPSEQKPEEKRERGFDPQNVSFVTEPPLTYKSVLGTNADTKSAEEKTNPDEKTPPKAVSLAGLLTDTQRSVSILIETNNKLLLDCLLFVENNFDKVQFY